MCFAHQTDPLGNTTAGEGETLQDMAPGNPQQESPWTSVSSDSLVHVLSPSLVTLVATLHLQLEHSSYQTNLPMTTDLLLTAYYPSALVALVALACLETPASLVARPAARAARAEVACYLCQTQMPHKLQG